MSAANAPWNDPPPEHTFPTASWRERLVEIVDTMREMSRQTDPQSMVAAYATRVRRRLGIDRTISLSRRGLQRPYFRITRDSEWNEAINPWKENGRLQVIAGGAVCDLIYSDEPCVIDGASIAPDDPMQELLGGYRTIVAIPHYDRGEGLNMVLLMWKAPGAFDLERLPDAVQTSNLFGRATNTLVLKTELEQAYKALDHELEVVAEIQRSLLPRCLPSIPGVSLAASYQTSRQAGGDYYDVFCLPGGKWGILIADVSGHGTPAAVVMAITHAISHSFPGPPAPASSLLTYVNQALATRYTADTGNFVTAFYGVYDPETRELAYSSAGHNPPLFRHACGNVVGLDAARSVPLGIVPGEQYPLHRVTLKSGDAVLFYTDGITEAWSAAGEMYGERRLDAVVGKCDPTPSGAAERLVENVLASVSAFSEGRPADDDRTLLALCVE